eukprot:5121988-Prymnesium_polylepis.1
MHISWRLVRKDLEGPPPLCTDEPVMKAWSILTDQGHPRAIAYIHRYRRQPRWLRSKTYAVQQEMKRRQEKRQKRKRVEARRERVREEWRRAYYHVRKLDFSNGPVAVVNTPVSLLLDLFGDGFGRLELKALLQELYRRSRCDIAAVRVAVSIQTDIPVATLKLASVPHIVALEVELPHGC